MGKDMSFIHRKALVIWALMITAISVQNAQGNELYQQLFNDGCKWRGEHYAKVRQGLENQGEKILPFLEKKKASKDFNENMFARILIKRIQDPKAAEKWHQEVLKLIPYQEANQYNKLHTDKLPKTATEIPVEFMVDMLWENKKAQSNHPHDFPLLLSLQYYLNPSLEAMRASFDLLTNHYSTSLCVIEGTKKLGLESASFLRNEISKFIHLNPSIERDDVSTQKERDEWNLYEKQSLRMEAAMDALFAINDKEAIPLLIKCLSLRHRYYKDIETITSYLARFKAVESVNPMMDFAIYAAERNNLEGRHENPGFIVTKDHIMKLGKGVIPALRKRLSKSTKEVDRIIINSFIHQLSGIESPEAKIAKLKEDVLLYPRAENLLLLHSLTKEDVFKRLVDVAFMNTYHIRFPVNEQNEIKVNACLALGKLNDRRAIPLLKNEIIKLHKYLKEQINGKNIFTFNAQKVRETGYAYGTHNTSLAKILNWGDTCVLALQRMSLEDAKQALQEISILPEYKILAETSLLHKTKPNDVVKQLESKSSAEREAAALVLYENKDSRSVLELLRATARRQGPSHLVWKKKALSFNVDLTEILKKLSESLDVREKVLGQSMLIEVTDAKRAAKCEKLLLQAAERVSMMHYHKIGMVESSGERLAKEIQKEDISMIQSKCLFAYGVIRRGVAAFALGEHKSDTSMNVLAQSINMGSMGGSNPAAMTLLKYGDKAKDLIAKTPAPSPGQHDTGLRVTMHRYGTRVLAEQKDVRGVEELLKGIKTLSEDTSLDRWQYRLGIYLSAAHKMHDKRLVDPLINLLDLTEVSDNTEKILDILSAYDHKRLIPLFVSYLRYIDKDNKHIGHHDLFEAGATSLSRNLKGDIGEFLIKVFNESEDIKIRKAALFTLASLSYDYTPYPGDRLWHEKAFESEKKHQEAYKKVHKLAYQLMLKAIKDPNPKINQMAAMGLTILAQGRESEGIVASPTAVPHLNAWCKSQNKVLYSMIEFLEEHGNKESEKILLNILKSYDPSKGNRHIVYYLAKKKTEGAIPVLSRNLLASGEKSDWEYSYEELEGLHHFGQEGAKAIHEVLNQIDDINGEIRLVEALGALIYKRAVEDVAKVLKKLITDDWQKLGIYDRNYYIRKAYLEGTRKVFKAYFALAPELAKKEAEKVLLNGPEMLKLVAIEVWAMKPSDIKAWEPPKDSF